MKLRKPHSGPRPMRPAEADAFAVAVARLIVMAETHGCNSLTAHTESGIWRVTVTKISGLAPEPGGNYNRSGLPR